MHDRPYWKDTTGGEGGNMVQPGGSQLRLGFPPLTPVVKILLIINAAVFIAQIFLDRTGILSILFGVSVKQFWAFWTYITFQFLHSTQNFSHILLNMLGLYFFGTELERTWGGKSFLKFYLGCGAAAGVLYVVIGAIFDTGAAIPLIGASGGVFGLLLACAVYFPHFRVFVFLFPLPIRVLAVIVFGLMGLGVLNAIVKGTVDTVMSDVAHLGGALAAAFRIWAWPIAESKISQNATQPGKGAWKRKLDEEIAEEKEVDRILQKIQREGIGSLSNSERNSLQRATERQREKDRRAASVFKNR